VKAVRTEKAWRTKHEVECNLEAVRGLTSTDLTNPSAEIVRFPHYQFPVDLGEYIVVGIGCAGYKVKQWAKWKELSEDLFDRGLQLVFLGTKDDSQDWMKKTGTNLCGETSLPEAAGILRSARLYIGIDNGLSHLAASVRCSMVLLYGPSSERKNIPWSTGRVRVLRAEGFGCAPCWDRESFGTCTLSSDGERPCIAALSRKTVVNTVLEELHRPGCASSPTTPVYLSSKQAVVNSGPHLLQNHGEFVEVLEILRRISNTTNIGEIGAGDGAWLEIVSRVLGPGRRYLVIDPHPTSHPRGNDPPPEAPRRFPGTVERIRKAGNDVDWIEAISSSEIAFGLIHHWILRNGLLDVLHIDGDHREEAVRADWRLAERITRPGGLVIFHDISSREYPAPRQVWNEAKRGAEMSWAVQKPGSDFGIGIIQIKKEVGFAVNRRNPDRT
jgi:hypothetical protein